jgi:hypothetical protein
MRFYEVPLSDINWPFYTLLGIISATNITQPPPPKNTTGSTPHFTTSHRPGKRHLPCDSVNARTPQAQSVAPGAKHTTLRRWGSA